MWIKHYCIVWCTTEFKKFKVNRGILPVILELFMLPSADTLYGDAQLIYQQIFDLPALPNVPIPVLLIMVSLGLLDLPTNWPYLSLGVLSRGRHPTWQNNKGFLNTSATSISPPYNTAIDAGIQNISLLKSFVWYFFSEKINWVLISLKAYLFKYKKCMMVYNEFI